MIDSFLLFVLVLAILGLFAMIGTIHIELRALLNMQFKIFRALKGISELLIPVQSADSIEFYTTINGELVRVRHMFLKASQKLPVSIVAKDKFGNMAKVDGAAQFALTDESMGTISSTGDMTAEFIPSGKAGVVKLQGKVDADMGEGVKEIVGEMEVEVMAGDAEVVEMAAGEPSDI